MSESKKNKVVEAASNDAAVKLFDNPQELINAVKYAVGSVEGVIAATGELRDWEEKAGSVSVEGEEDLRTATDIIVGLKGNMETVKTEYDLFAKKANVIHKGITAARSESLKEFNDVIGVIDLKVFQWNTESKKRLERIANDAESDATNRSDNLPPGTIVPIVYGIPDKIKTKNGSLSFNEKPVVRVVNTMDVLIKTVHLPKDVLEALREIKFTSRNKKYKNAAEKLLDMFGSDRFPIAAVSVSEPKLAKHCDDMGIEAGEIGGISVSYVSDNTYRGSRKKIA